MKGKKNEKNNLFNISNIIFLNLSEIVLAGGEVVWQENGVPIGDSNYLGCVAILEDGAGGAILAVKNKLKMGSIYAQRIDSDGNILWLGNGVLLRDTTAYPGDFSAMSDNKGGMILVWKDNSPSPHIRAQRVDSSGNALWGEDGIVVIGEASPDSIPNADYYPVSVSDGYGGAIIAWTKVPSSFTEQYLPELYAQRVNSSGKLLWGAEGICICVEANTSFDSPAIVSDDNGGIIVAWTDSRNENDDIYAQRIDGNGILKWQVNGVPVCIDINLQAIPSITGDGDGGCIIVWNDLRNDNWDIYAQKVNKHGVTQWENNGVIVCDFDGTQGGYGTGTKIRTIGNVKEGVIIIWDDLRLNNHDIYVQKVDKNGIRQWNNNGVFVCHAADSTHESIIFNICSDRRNGAIFTWKDYRSGNWDIYSQHVDSSGVLQWGEDGLAVCTDSEYQRAPLMVPDGQDGAIIVWRDLRAGTSVYAQRVRDSSSSINNSFNSPNPEKKNIKLLRNYPNPFNPLTVINYQLSVKNSVPTILKIYNIMGKEIRTLVDQEQSAGSYTVQWNGKDFRGCMVANGLYFYQLKAGGYYMTKKLVLLK